MKTVRPMLAVALLTLGACDCLPFSNCEEENNELSVTVLKTETRSPNNYVVSLKVVDTDGYGLAGLDSDNFELREDGNLASKYEASSSVAGLPGEFAFHTGLVLDMSGSITQPALDTLKLAAGSFVRELLTDELRSADLAVWWFDGNPRINLVSPFSRDSAAIGRGIRSLNSNLSTDNSTDLNGAIIRGLDAVSQRVAEDGSRQVASAGALIVFTDGTDRAQRQPESAVRKKVGDVRPAVSTFTIGLGGEVDRNSLKDIGRAGSFFAANSSELLAAFRATADQVRRDANSFYQIRYCTPSRQGSHELKITVKSGKKRGTVTVPFTAADVTTLCK
jgi:uncharacterized protein YegL